MLRGRIRLIQQHEAAAAGLSWASPEMTEFDSVDLHFSADVCFETTMKRVSSMILASVHIVSTIDI
jgi:hypothetical protein